MIENILNRGKHTVRRMILPPGRDGKNRILLVFAAFVKQQEIKGVR